MQDRWLPFPRTGQEVEVMGWNVTTASAIKVGHIYHSKAGCVASQVRLFGTEVPEGINYAQKRKNSRGVLGLLNTAELCAGNTERKQ